MDVVPDLGTGGGNRGTTYRGSGWKWCGSYFDNYTIMIKTNNIQTEVIIVETIGLMFVYYLYIIFTYTLHSPNGNVLRRYTM